VKAPITKRRSGNHRWKHIYGVDRGYSERIDRLKERNDTRSASNPSTVSRSSS
jgi:hypothetical protein